MQSCVHLVATDCSGAEGQCCYRYQSIATNSLTVTDMCSLIPDWLWFGLLLFIVLRAAPFFFHEPAPSQHIANRTYSAECDRYRCGRAARSRRDKTGTGDMPVKEMDLYFLRALGCLARD